MSKWFLVDQLKINMNTSYMFAKLHTSLPTIYIGGI